MSLRTLFIALCLVALAAIGKAQDQTGGLSGRAIDNYFQLPVFPGRITIAGTKLQASTDSSGSFLITGIPVGRYSVVFSADGFQSRVYNGIDIGPGQLVELNAELAAEVTQLEAEVIEAEPEIAVDNEAAVIELRLEIDKFVDGLSKEQLGKIGASDAGDALKAIPGASLGANDTAVIRGLPDRYVVTLLNGVRLPSADEETRAVQLDLFPASIIDTIFVEKAFTPSLQGDASGGSLDIRLKTIPTRDAFFDFSSQVSFNTNAGGRDDFLTYSDGGLSFFGNREGASRRPLISMQGQTLPGGLGAIATDSPIDHKWSMTGGGRFEPIKGLTVGGFSTLFYERDSSFDDEARDDRYEAATTFLGEPGPLRLVPSLRPQNGEPGDDFVSLLFDVTNATQTVQWGSLTGLGVEYEGQSLDFIFLYTRTTTDNTSRRIDTRGRGLTFPGHDPNDPTTPGHEFPTSAPFLRQDILTYTERTLSSFQISGNHVIPFAEYEIADLITTGEPTIDWTFSINKSIFDQPDRRFFTARWIPGGFVSNDPPTVGPGFWEPVAFGELSQNSPIARISKKIEEESRQFRIAFEHPFKANYGGRGALRYGLFYDTTDRVFDINSITGNSFGAPGFFNEPLSLATDINFSEGFEDVDYTGQQELLAGYLSLRVPITDTFAVLGGVRIESTSIATQIQGEEGAPPGTRGPQIFVIGTSFLPSPVRPGEGESSIEQIDILPSIGLEWRPEEKLILRANYAETLARPVFRELAPVILQEVPGAPFFVGNSDLKTSFIRNYDLRADWSPREGSLLSVSWFRKDIKDIIEVIGARSNGFGFTGPLNFPEGKLTGVELEVRHQLKEVADWLDGFEVGGNVTVISSKVQQADLVLEGFFQFPFVIESRRATFAPEYLYNVFLNYTNAETGTSGSLFYSVQGDTVVEGNSAAGVFIPDVVQKEVGTLNFTLSQRVFDNFRVRFQAKNLLNPLIREIYDGSILGQGEIQKSSFTRGVDFSLSVSADFTF